MLSAPVPSSLLRWVALALVLLGALAVRTCDLARRPMHADEANQAVKTGELLEHGTYAFDPRDHHGPTLYYFAAAMARARGERTLAALTETTVRLVPACFGAIAVLLLGLLISSAARNSTRPDPAAVLSKDTGGLGGVALLAMAFLAVMPAAVYYARYFIHETLLLTFVLLTLLGVRRGICGRRLGWTCVGAVAAGCAIATKETALLFFAAAAVATWFTRSREPNRERGLADLRGGLVLVWGAALVAAVFYTSFGTHVAGLRDAIAAPWLGLHRVATGDGQTKPWWYYLALLTWHESGGLVWQQVWLIVLALLGAVAGWRRWQVRWSVIYAALVLTALSASPYKTPWNVVHVLPAIAFLAATGVLAIAKLRTGRLVAAVFGTFAVLTLAAQTYRSSFRYAADARNPYAYVHSSPDVLKFRSLVAAALTAHPDEPVRVISPEYWPLPWYLRGLPRIGYWPSPPTDCDGALVIAAAQLVPEVTARLTHPYRQSYLGLRPGYTLVIFTPNAPR